MKVLSLFDGISCGALALQRLNINIEKYVAYEIDEFAIQVSKNNFPFIEHKGDVKNAHYNQGDFDLLIGGSPCTYWSNARSRNTKILRERNINGCGGDLFKEYVRILNEVKPQYFLFENNANISKEIKNFISESLGVNPVIIDSALVSGQTRLRCYWTNIPNVKQPKDKNIMFYNIVSKNRNDWRPFGSWVYTNKYFGKPRIEIMKTFRAEKAYTLTTHKGHPQNYYCNDEKTMYSNLTINEYEQLQTLPIDYTKGIKNSERYKVVGNAWTVDVIAHIFNNLKEV